MKRTNEVFFKNHWKRVLIILPAFVILYLIGYIMDPFSEYARTFFHRDISEILTDFGITLIFCTIVCEISILISNWLDHKLPWIEHSRKRFVIETLLNFVAVLGILFIIFSIYSYYVPEAGMHSVLTDSKYIQETREIMQQFLITLMVTFLIMVINTGNSILLKWKNTAVRAAESDRIAMEAELQSLKLQLDLHFVFNNLSVLSELILRDQQLGYEYAENFTKIYRYMLVNSKKNIIHLEEEIKFLNAYIFLLKQRVGEGLIFEIDIDRKQYLNSLPPLTLQLLVENAMKHNKTSKSDPLHLKIYTNCEHSIVIENNFNPLETNTPSSGIGLENIVRRYRLLGAAKPEIFQDDKIFKVTVPLIELK
ncbi:TPA: sensor histidine kinase [Elizabethkingia anophelis]